MTALIRGVLAGRAASTGLSGLSGGILYSVAAASSRRAWAVGSTGRIQPGRHMKALILAWNGTSWKRAPIPAVPDASLLLGVAAVSARDAWAVGEYGARFYGDVSGKSLILHWNGRRWKRVPGPAGSLVDITARSASDAWAVGSTKASKPLIIRWNGRTWKRVASPGWAGGRGDLIGVAAASSRSAWAVGFTGSDRTLILRWSGRAWTRVPAPSGKIILERVAVTPAGGAWAVGGILPSAGNGTPVILRWNGHGWTRVASPNTGNAQLEGVAAISARGAFAVGARIRGLPAAPLIMRWNGTAWKVVPS
jgi:hypothetical protein